MLCSHIRLHHDDIIPTNFDNYKIQSHEISKKFFVIYTKIVFGH